MKQKVLVITHYPQECGAPFWCVIDAKTLLEIERVERPYVYYHNVYDWIESENIERRPLYKDVFERTYKNGISDVMQDRYNRTIKYRVIKVEDFGNNDSEREVVLLHRRKLTQTFVRREVDPSSLNNYYDYEDKDALMEYLVNRDNTNDIQEILEFLRPQYEIVNNIEI